MWKLRWDARFVKSSYSLGNTAAPVAATERGLLRTGVSSVRTYQPAAREHPARLKALLDPADEKWPTLTGAAVSGC
jgi:hypothetical protein